jgi:hypothetical protein
MAKSYLQLYWRLFRGIDSSARATEVLELAG